MNKLQLLSNYLGVSTSSLFKDSLTAPRKYKEFTIPKKKGGRRKISQPSEEVKVIQHAISELILNDLLISDYAYAYMKGRSIYDNAFIHKDSSYLLKLDFKNFFHSIRPEHLKYYIKNKIDGVSDIEINIMNNFLFWFDHDDNKLKLCMGAPTSPLISNIVMYEFDEKIAGICKDFDVKYSRYADDITLSSDNRDDIDAVEIKVNNLIKETNIPLLELNKKKRVFVSKHMSKRVTGIIITHDKNLSVGRYKRKKIKALLHYIIGEKIKIKIILYYMEICSFYY
ncbi:RNA-directed DNA polymerase [Photobacterium sp. GB-27]|uniref:retron St85 family RNA-directed DNA polymerase n=1 Tax=Photobacterium sp. GB-27 TaxID=2022109 RepID=UPI000D161851|nr:retron St85 family RNA-directed DNA polymerase [Photobacterium sp. GB-27]PSV31330.1 RNA-directed DNA polymerase [Photobacterium sp. GB-27]